LALVFDRCDGTFGDPVDGVASDFGWDEFSRDFGDVHSVEHGNKFFAGEISKLVQCNAESSGFGIMFFNEFGVSDEGLQTVLGFNSGFIDLVVLGLPV